MAELKKKPTAPVYGSLAYDLDVLVVERQLDEAGIIRPEPERRREEEVVRRPRQQQAVKPKAQLSPLALGSVAILSVLVVVLLLGYVKLTTISTSVTEMKEEMEQLADEHVGLLTRYEQTFEMAAVKEAAEDAGMSKPSVGQIEYVDLGGSDSAVVYANDEISVLDRFFQWVEDCAQAVAEYFR